MLIGGVLLRLCAADLHFYISEYHSMVLRKVAFLIILIRGGLSLEADQLRKFKVGSFQEI